MFSLDNMPFPTEYRKIIIDEEFCINAALPSRKEFDSARPNIVQIVSNFIDACFIWIYQTTVVEESQNLLAYDEHVP